MDLLAVKKKKLEIQRVDTAMMDLDVRCDELHDEIERLKKHIEVSKLSLVELKNELKQLEGK